MAWWKRDRRSEAERSLADMQVRPQPQAGSVPSSPALPAESPAPLEPTFTMPIEDVFTITGRGTVVTGRVATGEVQVDAPAWVVRADGTSVATTITGVEMFRRLEQVARAGENVGLLLAGVDRSDVERGDTVTA